MWIAIHYYEATQGHVRFCQSIIDEEVNPISRRGGAFKSGCIWVGTAGRVKWLHNHLFSCRFLKLRKTSSDMMKFSELDISAKITFDKFADKIVWIWEFFSIVSFKMIASMQKFEKSNFSSLWITSSLIFPRMPIFLLLPKISPNHANSGAKNVLILRQANFGFVKTTWLLYKQMFITSCGTINLPKLKQFLLTVRIITQLIFVPLEHTWNSLNNSLYRLSSPQFDVK